MDSEMPVCFDSTYIFLIDTQASSELENKKINKEYGHQSGSLPDTYI